MILNELDIGVLQASLHQMLFGFQPTQSSLGGYSGIFLFFGIQLESFPQFLCYTSLEKKISFSK